MTTPGGCTASPVAGDGTCRGMSWPGDDDDGDDGRRTPC